MKETLQFKNDSFQWIDFEGPSPKDLEEIGRRFQLHETSIQDCLDPEHLPKFEIINDINFMILRAPEESPPKKGISIQDLTRKVALFWSPQFLITIHRTPLNCVDHTKQNLIETHSAIEILVKIMSSILKSYEKQIDKSFIDLESHESGVFSVPGSKPFHIKSAYFFKRRTFVNKLILKLTRDAISKLTSNSQTTTPLFQDLKENCESLFFYVDELYENVTTLIGLHVSLATQKTTEASYKTGEIIRILTLFSIFLLPLNVITGIYGMNFENMPELKSPYGYPLAITAMLIVIITTYIYMHRKGWLK